MRKISVLMILAWACQSQQRINTQPTVPELVMGAVRGVDKQQWSPPVLRLGDAVHPRRYGVRLRIVPSEQTFTGGDHCCRSEEHTSELQSHLNLVCRLLLEKKKAC